MKPYKLLLLVSVIFMACQPDEDSTITIPDVTIEQDITQVCDTNAVIMVSVDTSCYYVNTDTFYLDAQTTSHADYDLDMDGVVDVRLDIYSTSDFQTHKIIPLSNNWSFAVKTNPNYGNCSIKSFAIGDTLNVYPKWTSCSEYMLMRYEDPNIPDFDPMPDYNNVPYLIFRKDTGNGYKYGWAKLNYINTVSMFYSIIGIGPSYFQK